MKAFEWPSHLVSDPFRAAVLLMLLAGLIITAWHIWWLHNQDRYQMQVQERYGLVFILDQQEGTVYFAQQGQIVDGWTDVWRKAPTLPTEK
jgi:hypothetical protein